MFHIFSIRSVRAALGAALLTVLAACSDMPSGLRQPLPGPQGDEHAVAAPADRPLVGGADVHVLAGEHRTTRTLRRADGHSYQVDVVRSADGLAREMSVRRDGVPLVRLVNDWQAIAGGYKLNRQRLIQFTPHSTPSLFDTHARGGVESVVGSSVVVAMRPRRALPRRAAGETARAGRILSLDGSGDPLSGPCDGAARSADVAIEDWLLSVGAMAGATASGNPFAAWMAYAYQVKKYRDMGRAESALDDCVANAGRRNDDEL